MLPDIHRATQKFYIFLIVYLTGCTPFYLLRASPLLRKSELFSSRCRVIMDKTIMKNLYRR